MPKTHIVREGECIASIGFDHGFFPATIWNHAQNAALRETRRIATVLQPGDQVVIPDREPKSVVVATGKQHVFRRKGVPETLCLRFVDAAGKPRASLAWKLTIDGAAREGTTDADGSLRAFIPPNATSGVLVLTDEKGHPERYDLQLGHLPPVTETAGVQSRLSQLGYSCADDTSLAASIRLFQREHGLSVTGESDATTQAKLTDVFGA